MNDLIGQHLGPYRILEQIGTGGMATVYKAYQPAMDRYVAVKVIASHFAQDETFLRRFRREARAVARLEHAHILPVYDSGEAEGRPYLVMRYLEAGTLKYRMVEGPLPLSEVNRIIGQVGSALDYAHRMGVIHRDVKPTNILLDAEGDAFLTDFGLAKMVESSVQLTGTGVGIGTPTYMSPEQGKGAKVDSRTDVYSLGVMLYELVTGHAPYEAETPLAVVLKHITEPLPLPRSIRPDLPEEVERVILRAMAKEPDDRFQTAGEMVQALDGAVRAAEAAARTEPAVPAARVEPVVPEVAAPPTERAVARARKPLLAKWGRVAAWVAVGIAALVALFLVLSRVPLKVQISGGQLEVVRVVEETATPTETATASVTPTPAPSPMTGPTPSALVYTSSGERTEGFYGPAGGTSCCGCQVRHYGNLPADFPESDVSAVTFYLTTSREDSYYTHVKAGPSKLMLTLGDKESTATSRELPSGTEVPVKASWLITFEFDPPVRAMPGIEWQLLDGDDNIYSNVWLHCSDIDKEGLPGAQEIYDCQYAGVRNAWYSVKLDLAPSIAEPTPAAHTPTPHPTATLTAVTVKWTYTAPDVIWSLDSWGDGLTTGDLNDDGVPDVVFGTGGGYVTAVNGANGEELWSYRITTQTGTPVNADVVDVDDDGVLDVVGTGKGDSTSQGKAIICVLGRDGTRKWQALGDYEEAVDLAYSDIDGDGDTDVVASVGTYSWGGGQVILIEGTTGERVWSQSLGSGHAQGIDARDVDGDGDMEVAVENYDNKVFLLDGATGSILWSHPKGYHGRDVIIEDVDDDETYEIVSVVANVISYDPSGSQEWATSRGGDSVSASDVNGDGQTEVVFSSAFAGDLHVVKGNTGEELWSRTRSGVHAVGDVNGDGVDDIVAGTIRFYGIEPPYSVDAVDGSNNLLWGYPLDSIHNEGGFGLAAANLDSDPALEVLVANGTQLLILDTGIAPTASSLAD